MSREYRAHTMRQLIARERRVAQQRGRGVSLVVHQPDCSIDGDDDERATAMLGLCDCRPRRINVRARR